jgi:hypothetical protein
MTPSGLDGDTSNFQQNEVSASSAAIVAETLGDAGTTSSNVFDTAAPGAPESSENPRPRKKRGKNKAKDPPEGSPTKKRGKGKDGTTTATPPTQASGSNQAPVPFPYGMPYGAPMHTPYQVPYYMPPPHYNMPAQAPGPSTSALASTSTPASTSQTTTPPQAPPGQQMYRYPPQPYGHYPPYGSNPYAPQQPYAQYPYPYLAQSQPHLQPYGPSIYPGQLPYSYGPPKSAPPQVCKYVIYSAELLTDTMQQPRTIKPVQRRKRRRDDQELPGPNGSMSYTSVFSARQTSPTPTPDPKPASSAETSLPPEDSTEHDVLMAAPELPNATISSVSRRPTLPHPGALNLYIINPAEMY